MTKTNSFVKRIIAIILSAMFALTSFTITGFMPTMEAQANVAYNDSIASYLTDKIDSVFSASSGSVEWKAAPDGVKAAYFDGTNGLYANIGTSILDQMTGNQNAIAFMSYRTCSDSDCTYFDICTKNPSTNNTDIVGNRSVSLGPNRAFRTSCYSSSSWRPVSEASHSSSTESGWDYWVITWDSTNASQAVKVYKNNSSTYFTTSKGSGCIGSITDANAVNNHELFTGQDNSARYLGLGINSLNSSFFKGYIRDFRIYKSNATADNVNSIISEMKKAAEESKDPTGETVVYKFSGSNVTSVPYGSQSKLSDTANGSYMSGAQWQSSAHASDGYVYVSDAMYSSSTSEGAYADVISGVNGKHWSMSMKFSGGINEPNKGNTGNTQNDVTIFGIGSHDKVSISSGTAYAADLIHVYKDGQVYVNGSYNTTISDVTSSNVRTLTFEYNDGTIKVLVDNSEKASIDVSANKTKFEAGPGNYFIGTATGNQAGGSLKYYGRNNTGDCIQGLKLYEINGSIYYSEKADSEFIKYINSHDYSVQTVKPDFGSSSSSDYREIKNFKMSNVDYKYYNNVLYSTTGTLNSTTWNNISGRTASSQAGYTQGKVELNEKIVVLYDESNKPIIPVKFIFKTTTGTGQGSQYSYDAYWGIYLGGNDSNVTNSTTRDKESWRDFQYYPNLTNTWLGWNNWAVKIGYWSDAGWSGQNMNKIDNTKKTSQGSNYTQTASKAYEYISFVNGIQFNSCPTSCKIGGALQSHDNVLNFYVSKSSTTGSDGPVSTPTTSEIQFVKLSTLTDAIATAKEQALSIANNYTIYTNTSYQAYKKATEDLISYEIACSSTKDGIAVNTEIQDLIVKYNSAYQNLKYQFNITIVDGSNSDTVTMESSSRTISQEDVLNKINNKLSVPRYEKEGENAGTHNTITWNVPSTGISIGTDNVNNFTINSQSAPHSMCSYGTQSWVNVDDTYHQKTCEKCGATYKVTHNKTIASEDGLLVTRGCRDNCGWSKFSWGKPDMNVLYGFDDFTQLGSFTLTDYFESTNDLDGFHSFMAAHMTSIVNLHATDAVAENGEIVTKGTHIINDEYESSFIAHQTKVKFNTEECDYNVDHRTSPTCTTEGLDVYTCTVCNDVVNVVLPTTGHTWGEWQTVTPATCTTKGTEQHECSVCHTTETRDIDPLGHDYQFTQHVDPTCVAQGYDLYTCSRCPSTEKRDYEPVDPDAHHYVKNLDTSTKNIYVFTSTCEYCGDVEYNKSVDLSAFIPAIEKAQIDCSDASEVKYTQDSRDELQEIIDGALEEIDYTSWTKDTSIDDLPDKDTVDEITYIVVSSDQVGGDYGVLVYNQYEVTFNYVLDNGAVQNQSTGTYDYSSYVHMTIDDIKAKLSTGLYVTKWIRSVNGAEEKLSATTKDMTYIVAGPATYTVYLSTTGKGDTKNSTVSMYDRIDRINRIEAIPNGKYDIQFYKDPDSQYRAIKFIQSGSEKLTLDIPLFTFYNADTVEIGGITITSGNTKQDFVISENIKIVPKYTPSAIRSLNVQKGITVEGDDITLVASIGTYDWYQGGWDKKVTLTAPNNEVVDWYVGNDPTWGRNDTLVHRGSTYTFRLADRTNVRIDAASADAPIASVNYLTYGGYREKTITAIGHYYLPEGCTFDETGVILKTSTTSLAAVSNSVDYKVTNKSGVFKGNNLINDTAQYCINVSASKTYSRLYVGAVTYVKYHDNTGDHVVYSPVVTTTYVAP